MDNLEANRQQVHTESDAFALDRYRQFASHLSGGNLRVLDFDCNMGRGGKVLEETLRDAELHDIDPVSE